MTMHAAYPKTVVIGGSAGSLTAVRELFEFLPLDSNLAFVLIQHLNPTNESHLHSLIAKWTGMMVEPATEGIPIVANRVYVGLPGYLLSLVEGKLRLTAIDDTVSHLLPIDYFCKSLAQQIKSRSAAVILSGTGRDGTEGALAIRQAGGMVVVQDPSTTAYHSMPLNVMTAGLANNTLAAAKMAPELCKWALTGAMGHGGPVEVLPRSDHEIFDDILLLVREHAHKDMSGYKPTTLQRRIERRMGLNNTRHLDAYLKMLQHNPVELDQLSKDLLIGVTAFFRDPEAFAVMEEVVIPTLCSAKAPDEPVRVWIAGCSTGEEVYSIAILFMEWFAKKSLTPRIQIFATDIDDAALDIARTGFYSEAALAEVSRDRINRYFVGAKNGFRIDKSVRESIVFAYHNLISDPPFSKLDLVICRNLLIYLNVTTQRKLLSLFHFVLNPDGYLFLGSSENIGSVSRHFQAVSKPCRIFRHIGLAPRRLPQLPLNAGTNVRHLSGALDPLHELGSLAGQERIYRQILDRHAPIQLLVNSRYEVLFISGDSSAYLSAAIGQASHDLFKMAKPSLNLALRSAVNRAQQARVRTAVSVQVSKQKGRQDDQPVRIEVTPIPMSDHQEMLMICFSPEAVGNTNLPLASTTDDSWGMRQLEQELNATREDLQRTIESSRVSNEELKAANEEVMAMNEELQSANEELESSKEELQSLNEELSTANTTLDAKVVEVEALNDDLSNLINHADTATLLLDENLRIRRFTPACTKLMRVIPSDIGRPIDDLVRKFQDPDLAADCLTLMEGGFVEDREIADIEDQWYLRRILPYKGSSGSILGVVLTFPNVSSLRKANRELKNSEAKFHTMVDWTYNWEYWLHPDGHFRYMTPSVERITGFLPDEFNRNPELLNRIVHSEDAERWHQHFHSCLISHHCDQVEELEFRLVHKSGDVIWVNHSCRYVVDEDGSFLGLRVTVRDITDQRRAEVEIRNLAYFDSLTHLPNRRLLMDRLEHALLCSVRNELYGALIMLDLDHFKILNDTQGHDVGDLLLKEVAHRLLASVRQQDTVARLGGDEFVIMLEELGQTDRLSAGQVELIAEKIRLALNQPYRLSENGQLYHATPSLGVTLFLGHENSVDVLLKQADVALYQSKDAGRNAVRFFNPAMQAEIDARAAMEAALRRGLEQGELRLYYQPQVNDKGETIGAEALLRWLSPAGMVLPNQFIQLAEDTGLIIPVGKWVLDTACLQLKRWEANTQTRELTLSVNVSARQFHEPDFVEQIQDSLTMSGANPSRLKIELTESSLLNKITEVISRMQRLNQLGVGFSLDDFGTGYSSLSYLKQLPLDQVKIDQSFIRDLVQDPNDAAIVRAILAMSHSLGIQVIAEGVEYEEQRAFLNDNGCTVFQGYLFGKPMPIEQFLSPR